MGIFMLSDLFLKYQDGYIFGGATPTFQAPTTPVAEIPDTVVAIMQLI